MMLFCDVIVDLPNKCVSFILEDPDLLNSSEVREGLLQQVLGEAVGDTAAVDRAVGRAGLVVDFVEGQRFGVG